MFSGIVAGQGVLKAVHPATAGKLSTIRIEIRHRGLIRRVRIGDSVAVNGCCLTVVSHQGGVLTFDVLKETWKRTCLHQARRGERVNLEGSLRVGDTLGGHWVTGHIDGVGRIVGCEDKGADVLLEIASPRELMRWIVMKGSVALDGASLTIAKVSRGRFGVWLIPHTLQSTTLGWKRKGDFVNLEGDVLAKYAQNAPR